MHDAHKRWVTLISIVVAIALFITWSYYDQGGPVQQPNEVAKSPEIVCIQEALTEYARLKLLLLNQETKSELNGASDVQMTIAERRLEEEYCQKQAACGFLGTRSTAGSTDIFKCLQRMP